jgi:hypothetical protein
MRMASGAFMPFMCFMLFLFQLFPTQPSGEIQGAKKESADPKTRRFLNRPGKAGDLPPADAVHH